MKAVTVRDLHTSVKQALDAAQKDSVVVTRHGQPVAVLVGVEGRDWETVVLETSSELWTLLEERRGEATVSREELERALATD